MKNNPNAFYDWYGEQIGWDEMARQFGFKNLDELFDWQARKLGYDSFADLERSVVEECEEEWQMEYLDWLFEEEEEDRLKRQEREL